MASLLTLSDMETRVWDRIKDTDSANRAFDQTILDRFINRAYVLVKGIKDDRVIDRSPTSMNLAAYSAELSRLLTPTDIRRFEEVFPVSGASSTTPTGAPLEPMTPSELIRMQLEWAENVALPKCYAVWREQTATAASVGKWRFGVWPLPSAPVDLACRLIVEPTPLSSGTDKADCTDVEQFGIVAAVSAVGSRLIGRDSDMIAEINAEVPQFMRAGLELMLRQAHLTSDDPEQEPA